VNPGRDDEAGSGDREGGAPTRIARGDMAEELARLKQEPGGVIIAHGGTKCVRSLIRLGLLDEYRLWVLPAAVGHGAPLFTKLARPVTLSLAKTTAFPSGILELLRADRPRGVTFKIPNRAAPPAHEAGLERDVPGLAPTRLITPAARNLRR
jgi:dihydrofolate reductase